MDYTQGDDSPELLIADRYLVNTSQKQPDLSGCPAWVAQDITATGSTWLALAPSMPSPHFSDLMFFRHESVIGLHAHEYHAGSLWVLCPHPPGPSLKDNLGVWSESQIIDGVIRPIADALEKLSSMGLTCRGIRPDNLFVGQGLHQVVVGPLGVACNAEAQPVLFEPLSSAVCHPTARGGGTVACDIFSLGVLVLSLCIGELPLRGLSDNEILQRRFEVGSAEAYMQGHNVPAGLVSLLEAMLSDRPENRPSPNDLITIAPSKLFSIRPDIPARSPLVIGSVEVRTPQALAWYAGTYPNEFLSLLQRKIVSQWLHRELELSVMSSLIEQAGIAFLPSSGNKAVDPTTMVVTRAIAILDSAAPMFWAGHWFWPSAIPHMLACAEAGRFPPEEQRNIRGIAGFLMTSPEVFDVPSLPALQAKQINDLATDARRTGAKGMEQIRRVPYDVNVYQPCLSSRCLKERISLSAGLLQWLDRHVSEQELSADDLGRSGFLDDQMRTFLESHCARQGIIPLAQSQKAGLPSWLSDLTLMAAAQRRFDKTPLSAVAKRALSLLENELKQWRSKTTRAKRRARLFQLAETGNLTKFLDNVTDPAGLQHDRKLARQAEAEIAHLEKVLEEEPVRKAVHEKQARNAGEFFSLLIGIAVAMTSIWLEFCE
ncbi:protein kinase domain-containing protein [Gluconobacter cerinus]|uniref:Protein kinase domain protein n=1 Tax=Gluconobacter cerinus TaxID=38307 RepID=A0A1B6VJW8_9PROT|nr:hypothetical protein [Gluconobacter cerinus]OAJ67506.1 Protein kinase domain protein [Gluconobacter cerinus]